MPPSFYIIDGHAQIYRAYFAPFRDLTSPSGEPTKATYVFLQRLLNIIETRKPDYLAMVIDSGDGGTGTEAGRPGVQGPSQTAAAGF
jgi:DNA polymerase I